MSDDPQFRVNRIVGTSRPIPPLTERIVTKPSQRKMCWICVRDGFAYFMSWDRTAGGLSIGGTYFTKVALDADSSQLVVALFETLDAGRQGLPTPEPRSGKWKQDPFSKFVGVSSATKLFKTTTIFDVKSEDGALTLYRKKPVSALGLQPDPNVQVALGVRDADDAASIGSQFRTAIITLQRTELEQ